MKRIFVFICFLSILVVSGYYFISKRKNASNSIAPYPYIFKFQNKVDNKEITPILIIGDRQAEYFAKFKETISKVISKKLSKPIGVSSLALSNEGLHRTLYKIKSFKKLPLIIIYLGGTQEWYESSFQTSQIDKITENFNLYTNTKIKTVLMLFPALAKFIYTPVEYKFFTEKIQRDTKIYDIVDIQKRNILNYSLYKTQLEELFNYVKDRGSYIISITQALNLDAPPKKSCSGPVPENSLSLYKKVIKNIKKRDYKGAFESSKELSQLYPNNAKILYIHGKVAKNLGRKKEAIKYLKLSSAYDCKLWRGNIVYNAILKKVSKETRSSLFDFQKMLESDFGENTLFFDEIIPQGHYYERLAQVLGLRIKKILKL